ncbi:hypothetical protein D2M30_3931 [Bacillus amyloliquefaciens]|nr:hypothetical protein B425_3318 [Bacillus amyloliquefaciens]QBG58230.1 hypothetical protein D2M30_3931 [Bacillus amyloliquefaciens]
MLKAMAFVFFYAKTRPRTSGPGFVYFLNLLCLYEYKK